MRTLKAIVARYLIRHNILFMRHLPIRESREDDPARGISISTLAKEYPRGSFVSPHKHGSHQLIYASHGVMEVASGQRIWIIPPHFGLWVPARTAHQIRMRGPVSMRTLYLRPRLARLWDSCTVLHIRPFLRELIFEIVETGNLRSRNRLESALCDLLVSKLRQASPVPTGILFPRDDRAVVVAEALIQEPGLKKTLASMCVSAGISVRTLERCYRREVGIDFESWRRQVRLMKAVELLVSGRSVKETTFLIGYQSPNTFVTLFRRTFGITPKAWISALERIQ
jgi:AraC-like DNA-binding protein